MKKSIIFIIAGCCLIYLFIRFSKDSVKSGDSQPEFVHISSGNMTISIKESGFINAVNENIIKNEIDMYKIKIIDIVPDGSVIKKGDVLVKLDPFPKVCS